MDITMPALQVLLLAIMFLAILVEVKTGGTGAGIIFGLVAAGVFWGSQYVKGAADLFQIGLLSRRANSSRSSPYRAAASSCAAWSRVPRRRRSSRPDPG